MLSPDAKIHRHQDGEEFVVELATFGVHEGTAAHCVDHLAETVLDPDIACRGQEGVETNGPVVVDRDAVVMEQRVDDGPLISQFLALGDNV
jgi:hypothetical protein